jgi:septum site-determining protein MinD
MEGSSMKIINIVSGKGGTGKTLLVAVLAELLSRRGSKALLVDVDIFVRGLTCLLYYQQDRRTRLLNDNEIPVSDVIMGKSDVTPSSVGLARYRTFDVWPAVRRIDDELDFHDVMPNDFEEARRRVKATIQAFGKEWDVVLLDCRSGFDELVAAIHSLSDITVNVQEDDLIATITSDNLKSQLSKVSRQTPVYNLINKSRAPDIDGRGDSGTRDLGRIPFDADVRTNYGRESFWNTITESLIEPSLIEIWNNLCNNENMSELKMTSVRRTPIPIRAVEVRMSRLVTKQRILAIYGFLIGVGGLLLGFGGRDFVRNIIDDPYRAAGVLMGVFGIVMAFLSIADVVFRAPPPPKQ